MIMGCEGMTAGYNARSEYNETRITERERE